MKILVKEKRKREQISYKKQIYNKFKYKYANNFTKYICVYIDRYST